MAGFGGLLDFVGYGVGNGDVSVSNYSPTSGDELTGARVTFTGMNLDNVTAINFLGVSSLSLVVNAAGTSLSCVCPPLRADTADVSLVSGSGTVAAGNFTYNAVATKHQASMKSLMTKMKELLSLFKIEGAELDDVQQIKRGLRPSGVFPVIYILPQSTTVLKRYSSGRFDLTNTIMISLMTKTMSKYDSQDESLRLAKEIKRILKFYHPLQAGGYNLLVGDILVGKPSRGDTGLLRKISIPISIKTRRYQLPTSTSQTWTENSALDVLSQVYNTVKSYSTTDLADVNTKAWIRGATENVGSFPALVTILEDDAVVRSQRGLDDQERLFIFEIYDKLTARENSMDSTLDIADALMLVIWKNVNWGGVAWDSDLESVEYGQGETERGLLSAVSLTALVNCKEASRRTQ